MKPTRDKLIEQGHTWEEAEELLSNYAEEELDRERDRALEEKLTGERK